MASIASYFLPESSPRSFGTVVQRTGRENYTVDFGGRLITVPSTIGTITAGSGVIVSKAGGKFYIISSAPIRTAARKEIQIRG